MERKDVLKTYLDLCDSRSGFLQYHLPPNIVLDFFGRSICGKERVYQYIRNYLSHEYNHNFTEVNQCNSIEYKSSHMKTKLITDNNETKLTEVEKRENKVSLKEDDCTTPVALKTTPVLPKITRGRKFVPTEDDVLANDSYSVLTTPVQNLSTVSDTVDEPPRKRRKCADDFEYKEDKQKNGLFLEDSVSTIYFKDKLVNSTHKTDKEKETETKAERSPELNSAYSDLMYLETIGTLQINAKTAGSSITTEVNSPYDFNEERKTKIKISYRIRLCDNHLMFYLIIYENLDRNPAVRKNLFRQFQTETVEKPVINKTNSGLKSRMRLF